MSKCECAPIWKTEDKIFANNEKIYNISMYLEVLEKAICNAFDNVDKLTNRLEMILIRETPTIKLNKKAQDEVELIKSPLAVHIEFMINKVNDLNESLSRLENRIDIRHNEN